MLPDLTEECIRWAIEHNLRQLALDDIEAFLVLQDMESDIHAQSKEYLRVLSNVELKSREK